MYILFYIISIIISYFIFRKLMQIDKHADCWPHYFLVFVMLIPLINIICSSIFLLIISKKIPEFDYKKFYGI